MTAVLAGVLAAAVYLAVSARRAPRRRIRAALAGSQVARAGSEAAPSAGPRWRRRYEPTTPMTLLVQQLAALLKGGRPPSRLWEELWLLLVGEADVSSAGARTPVRPSGLAPGSVRMLAAARAAAMRGAPVGAAIRSAVAATSAGTGDGRTWRGRNGQSVRERRVWFQLAACLDAAEATGSPLADVLTRFAAQLEAENDAGAARQTALAGPRATVRLLTWLPFLGLCLGSLLGADPVGVLLGTPLGAAVLATGLTLTAAGRIWSARLVRAAERLRP
ncbi:type II secretion system F family protein [Arthrobacter sp. ES1]|uniref:type II secretion system F family protein n=2 Tax=Micrococcales TaxID=85006 RepID=UPI0037C176D4